MQYCVLIELGQTTVTFSAYTEGADGFAPYGDVPRPLAVWFSGSSVIIGRDAEEQAVKGTPNAFRDLFSQMKSVGHFDYANETFDYSKLVLFTLRAGIKEFFCDRLLNSQGSLEDNVSSLPLILMFGSDMDDDKCAVVESQLRDNGFGNVVRVNEDDYILRSLPAIYSKGTLILSSDGNSLFGDVYDGRKHMSSFVLPEAGRDPRVDKLAKLIWERSKAENDWLDSVKEYPELQKAANRFIASDEAEYSGDILLSNGQRYPYYLNKDDMRQLSNAGDTEFLNSLFAHVSDFVQRKECCVVLKGLAASNKYLQEKLKPEFATVLSDKNLIEASRNLLLEECKARNFQFSDGSRKESKPAPKAVAAAPFVQPVASGCVEPTKRDERDFKFLKHEVETLLANGRRARAEQAVHDFLQSMAERGIKAFDSEAADLLGKVSVTSAVEPTGMERRAMRVLEATVSTCLSNGQAAKAAAEIAAFRKEMQAKGITAFDSDLDKMAKQTASASPAKKSEPKPAASAAKAPKVQTVSEGVRLMRSGSLNEAREWFRANAMTDCADDCTAIIRWERVAKVYKSELEPSAGVLTPDMAKSRLKEINEKMALFKKYGLDCAELSQMANDYKQVK
ncbi:MAG: hypothetical protein ACI35Q_00820 [Marinilabiliaceae bacterium]